MSNLNLERSKHASVYREIVAILKEDGGLPIRRWATWDGHDDSPRPPSDGELPYVVFDPSLGADRWFGPEGFRSPLSIGVGLLIEGYDVDDAFDLYRAFVRALHPAGDAGNRMRQRLVDVGADTGEVLASTPRFAPAVDQSGSHRQSIEFVLSIDVAETINA
jgi:hypothetical protein